MNRFALLLRTLTLVSVLFSPGPLCRGQSTADQREAWKYSSNGGAGYFVNIGQGTWIEHAPGGHQYRFTESSRDPVFVSLSDASRGIQVRLEATTSFWKSQSASTWNALYSGAWVDRNLLPPSIAGTYRVRLSYFVPSDRSPTASYEPKIRTIAYFVSKFFNDTFLKAGISTSGLNFEIDPQSGTEVVHLIRGQEEASYYSGSPDFNPNQQWNTISSEVHTRFGNSEKVLHLIFAETYDEGSSPFEWPGAIAQGVRSSPNRGMAICSAWILKNEFCSTTVDGQLLKFADATPVVGRSAIGHGGVNSPRFEFIEDGIGAAIHEIGHCLGMIHDHRNDSFDLMGNGFRNIRHNFLSSGNPSQKCLIAVENLRIAATSRFANPSSNLADNTPPFASIKLAASPKRGDKKLSLSVNLIDSGTLRWITYFLVGSDSVVSGRTLVGTRQTFVENLRLSTLRRGPIDLRVFVGDSSGNITVIPLRVVVR